MSRSAGGGVQAVGWDSSPAGLLTLALDGTVVAANRTLLAWVGRAAEDVVGRVRLGDLLSVGGRIYWETHLSPLLHVEGRLEEVALELSVPAGRWPVLLSATTSAPADDAPAHVHVALTSARERSRYERELLRARASAERSAAQVRALQEVTAALSGAVGVEAVAHALLAAVVGPLAAAGGALWLPGPAGTLAPHGTVGRVAPSAHPSAEAVLAQRAATADDGSVVVPLHGHTALQGALVVAPSPDAGADPLDLDVLTAVGQQAGLALDRAQRYEQRASIARELQHSLLVVTVPADPRIAVAAAYQPGVDALEVGGDWYDVFPTADGVLSVLVGDVVGRGLGAAIAMGQLRSAVRALAGSHAGPARLLSRLDRFVEHVPAACMATLAHAQLHLADGRLRYACAGHLPPLLVPAAGAPRFLWGGRSTPLGAHLNPRTRAEAEDRLHPGDRLLLYTDGLVERRDRTLDAGLEALRVAAAGLAGVPAEQAVSHLTGALLPQDGGRDDVCLLLLTWRGAPFERDVAADLGGLSSARWALATWLTERGCDAGTCVDLVLAASEAVANAAEHALAGSPHERVAVRADLVAGDGGEDVVLRVQDRGRWRAPSAVPGRGRGLSIMRAVVDDLSVETDEGTTVVMRRRLRRAGT